jgi:HK97 family phage prohead protease
MGEVIVADLTPPLWVRAIARRAVGVESAVAVAAGNMTPAIWVEARDTLVKSGNTVWGVPLIERVALRFLETAGAVIGRIEADNEGRAKGNALSKMETRFNAADFEIREDSDGMSFEGYAAVFDSPSEPLPFIERIAPGAFVRSLKARNDVKMLWNHDTGSILGSTRAGTLGLSEDSRGLKVSAQLPKTSTGNDVRELLSRGDVDSMSFGFSVPKGGDEWSSDGSERTLREIRLHEVSIVAFPAYTATAGTTTVRGLDRVALRAEVDADLLADAIFKIEQGEDISADDRTLLAQVIAKLSPEDEVNVSEYDMLALKKKKLELMKLGI